MRRPCCHHPRLVIRLERRPICWICKSCGQCFDGIDADGRPVGKPYPVDPTIPIQDWLAGEAKTKSHDSNR
jgi:hypothetical protein